MDPLPLSGGGPARSSGTLSQANPPSEVALQDMVDIIHQCATAWGTLMKLINIYVMYFANYSHTVCVCKHHVWT